MSIFVIVGSVAAGLASLVGPASAVVTTPPGQAPTPAVQATTSVVDKSPALRIDVPLTWRLTRTRLLGPGATTLTESFRETWVLELRPGGLMNLRSPRANVSAYNGDTTAAKDSVPKTILVSEHDFARLVGIEHGSDAEDSDSPGPIASPITIQLARAARGGTDINLTWSEDEHYAVHLDVGANPVF